MVPLPKSSALIPLTLNLKRPIHRPMKLYVSALSGGGLSINSPFMGEMKKAAEAYETNYKTLDGKSRTQYPTIPRKAAEANETNYEDL